MESVSKNQIVRTLIELGILEGDIVLLHSSLTSIGHVIGGVDAIIDAFLDVVGEEGTLIMPAFTDNVLDPFDVLKTQSDVGIITEIFRKREGVLRSLHPTHSVCAIGKHASYITKDHNLSATPCGRISPFYKVRELKGKIVLLGVDMNRNTMIHAVEEEADVPYLVECFIVPAPTFIKDDGKKTFEIKKFPSGHRDFLKITPLLRENHLMREAFLGKATVKVIGVEKFFKYVLEILIKDKGYFLCENLYCNSCLAGRQKIEKSSCNDPDKVNCCDGENCEICVV